MANRSTDETDNLITIGHHGLVRYPYKEAGYSL